MKRIAAILLLLFICILILSSCEIEGYNINTIESTNNMIIPTNINKSLYYDINTKIVYIIWHEEFSSHGYGYMSPYMAPNGYPYAYDGKNNVLVEIDGE